MAQRAHHVSGRDGPPPVMPHIMYHVSWLMDTISFSQTPNACPPGDAGMQESHPPASHALAHSGATSSSNNVLELKVSFIHFLAEDPTVRAATEGVHPEAS